MIGPAPAADAPRTDVAFDELAAILATGSAVVVNVLSAEAYRAAHIPGSLSLPLADIPARAARVLPDRTRPIVVYCAADT